MACALRAASGARWFTGLRDDPPSIGILALAGLALLASNQAACVIADREVEVRVRSPEDVTVARDPRGQDAQSGVLAEGTFSRGGISSTPYELRSERREGALALHWMRPPIPEGELQTLVTSEGRIRFLDTDDASDVLAAGALSPSLSISCKTWLDPQADSNNGFIGYGAGFGVRASRQDRFAPVSIPFSLETPWSNVQEVRRRFHPKRQGALIAALATTGGVALLSGFMFALARNADSPTAHDGANVLDAVGGTFIGLGAVTDLLLLPTIVAPSVDKRVYATP